MKKFAKKFIIIMVAVVCCFAVALAGCTTSDAVGISSIALTSTSGNVDTYTIYYTDGSTSTYQVTNGTNGTDGEKGEDGTSVTVSDLYSEYVAIYGEDLTYAEFLELYLSNSVGISSIELTSTDGNVDTYTTYYTNGTTSTYTVTNGTDGEDGNDGTSVTVSDLYAAYKELYGDDLSYSDFLKLYLSTDSSSSDCSLAINYCLQSCLKVYTQFSYNQTVHSGYGPGSSTTTLECKTYAQGSAVIYQMNDDYTYIVTNYHVVYYYNTSLNDYWAEEIYCYLYGSEDGPTASETTSGYVTAYDYGDYAISCEYVGGSITADIAVLKAKTSDILAINENATAVTLGSDYNVGETVFAIGNTEGEGISVTQGIVSVKDEFITLQIDNSTRYYRSIRIDAAIYEGNSGGGLFNQYGELIGITNAGDGDDQNVNYAIPISIAQGVADNVIYYDNDGDDATSGAYIFTLGVTVNEENSKYVYNSETGYGDIVGDIVVSSVVESSIAESLGIEEDDVITALIINGEEYDLNRYFEIGDLILTVRAGDEIAVKYERNSVSCTTNTYTIASSDLATKE